MEWTSIILAVISAISGGLLGVLLTYKINSRKQDVNEYQFLLNERKEITNDLSLRVLSLETEVKRLQQNEYEHKTEIASLKNKIILFESSHADIPLPMWLKDTTGTMLYLNSAYEEQFLIPRDFTAADYIGNDDFSVWSDEISKEFRASDNKVVRNKSSIKTIETLEDVDGNIYYGLILKYPRKVNDKVIGISGIVLRTSKNKENLQK